MSELSRDTLRSAQSRSKIALHASRLAFSHLSHETLVSSALRDDLGAPRWLQERAKIAQERAKIAQERAKIAQERAKNAQERAKIAQARATIAPSWRQERFFAIFRRFLPVLTRPWSVPGAILARFSWRVFVRSRVLLLLRLVVRSFVRSFAWFARACVWSFVHSFVCSFGSYIVNEAGRYDSAPTRSDSTAHEHRFVANIQLPT